MTDQKILKLILDKVKKIDSVSNEVKKIKNGVQKLNSKIEGLQHDVVGIKKTQSEHGGLLLQIDEKVDHVDRKVDHLELKTRNRFAEAEAG